MKEYKFKTTLMKDFTTTEKKSIEEVKKKYKEIFSTKHNCNYIYLTELALVLRLKSEEHSLNNTRLSNLYNKLYEEVNNYIVQTLKDKELDYYFEKLD